MKKASIVSLFVLPLLLAVLGATAALAIGTVQDGADSARSADQPTNIFGDAGVFSQISSVLLFIVGAVAVIMIIIGGLRYVVSGGDSTQIQSAKNTILYTLIGVIIAILAYAAVNFVIRNFSPVATEQNTPSYGASER